jgi:hypothetical protein
MPGLTGPRPGADASPVAELRRLVAEQEIRLALFAGQFAAPEPRH